MNTMDSETVLQRVGEIARSVLAREAAKVDEDGSWPEEGLHALLGAGLGGLMIPTPLGGLGQSRLTLTQVMELLGRKCASTALCFGNHCTGSAILAESPNAHLQEHYLGPICAGKHLTSLAFSEAGTGAHFYFPQVQLVSSEADDLRLNGSKAFVTNGGRANSYVVSAVRTASGGAGGDFACVAVPGDASGIEWGPPWRGLGMRGNSSCTLDFKGTPVPAGAVLSQEGGHIAFVFNVMAPYAMLATGGVYLGIAREALDEARAHLGQRQYMHSGRTLGQEPVMQYRLGVIWGRVESAGHFLHAAARALDAGDPAGLPMLFAAKAEVAAAAEQAVNDALSVAGGIGYKWGSKLARLLRDSRAAHIIAPTTDMLRKWTGRALLDLPLLGD